MQIQAQVSNYDHYNLDKNQKNVLNDKIKNLEAVNI